MKGETENLVMKTKRIRDVVFVAHRYIGLAIGILAATIGMTGSLLILDEWQTSLFTGQVTIAPDQERLAIATLVTKAQAMFPKLTLESLTIPKELTQPVTAWWWAAGDKWTTARIHPYTGAIIGSPQNNDYNDFLYDIHINLLGGEWGAYVAGIVGLLATILCLTGIVLWSGWRRLATGFKIKWNATTKRLNYDLHKVVGIIVAIFLAMAMLTGFIWNFATWMNPVIYAFTFSPQPPKEVELVSKAVGKAPIQLTEALLQKASAALPPGEISSIYFPTKPEGVIRIAKELPNQVVMSASIDRFSGEIVKVDVPTEKSLADRIFDSFVPIHFGTFAGLPSRILYLFVGLSPTILLVTGFIMWRLRKRDKSKRTIVPAERALDNSPL